MSKENNAPEQLGCENEIEALQREIAHEAEVAFAVIPYPGDDKIVRSPTFWENDEVLAAFQGKHWRDLSVEVMFTQRDNQPLLSPEAFRFYLPAYLIAGLLHFDETDTLWENVFYYLTPPPSKGDRMNWFCARIAPLDARQKAVVRRYVELYVQIEGSLENPGRDRALLFWRRLTDIERAEGAEAQDQGSATQNILRAMGWEPAPSEQEQIEVKALEQDIAHEVEEAFAIVPYPGDDKMTSASPEWEKALGMAIFHGKHWRDLALEVLAEHRHKLRFFSPEAFRFFLPAYLLAALLQADKADELRDQVFYNLTPPREEGPLKHRFLARVRALDARQQAVVRRFMELWAKTATCYPDAIKEQGLSFWRTIPVAEPAPGGPTGSTA